MDTTITLATTASVVGQTARIARAVGEELHAFLVQDKLPQDTTRSLQGEVKSFGDTCDVLQLLLNGLAGPQAPRVAAPDEQFYVKVQQVLSEYATTVDELGQHIRKARNSKSSFLSNTLRPTKLGIKSEDLVRARQRVDSHLASVQLILGILNLVAYKWHRKQARLKATSQVNSPQLGQDQKLYASSATLILEADHAMNVATLVYEGRLDTRSAPQNPDRGSMASVSVVTLPIVPKQQPVVAPSPSISTNEGEDKQAESSVDLPDTNTDNVNQWIHGLMSELDKRQRSPSGSDMVPSPLRSNRSYSMAPSDVLSSQSTDEKRTSYGTSLTTPSISPLFQPFRGQSLSNDAGQQRPIASAAVDDSDDDDIEVELARNVIASGKTAFGHGDHVKARRTFLEGLSRVQQLPTKLQGSACDMLELRYQLAMCALVLDNDVDVERALVQVLQEEPKADVQRERLFHVSHILAQLYIRTARLGLARQTCNNALRGRRKLFGKESEGYYASLALMARICELQNASLRAQGYMDMIPAAERQKHSYGHLRVEIDDEKEVVTFAQAEPQPRRQTTLEPSFHNNFGGPAFDIVSPITPSAESSRPPAVRNGSLLSLPISESDQSKSFVSIAPSSPYQRAASMAQSFRQSVVRSGSSVKSPGCASDTGSVVASAPPSAPMSPPGVVAASYVDAPLSTRPGPDNDYLGYCRGAWLLQTGDRKAMKKTKDFNYGRSSN